MRRRSGDSTGSARLRPGFSFPELLIASGILAAAMVPLFLMQSTAMGRVKASLPSLFATALASEVAEQVRTLPFASLPTTAPYTFKPGSADPTARPRLPGNPPIPLAVGTYPLDASVTVLVEPLDPPDVLARLTVSVVWTEGPARASQTYRHVELIENRTGVVDDD